jgi:putative tricarboxylic transport membrane protein
MMTFKKLGWIVAGFFAVIIAIVFQQISTSMAEQGIASGGPYDNAAAYPRSVALIIAGLVVVQLIIDRFSVAPVTELEAPNLNRPAALLLVFALYLGVLSWLGYHITTTPMVFSIMWICGARQIGKLFVVALAMSFSFAFIFEKFLNVVLPGGTFGLNIPW